MRLMIFLALAAMLLAGAAEGEAYVLFTEAQRATFADAAVQLSGAGSVLDGDGTKPYGVSIRCEAQKSTWLRFQPQGQAPFEMHIERGGFWTPDGEPLAMASLFARLTAAGWLDSFFALELLLGPNAELYAPYMALGPDVVREGQTYRSIQLDFAQADVLALLEAAERQFTTLGPVMRRITSALEAEAQYCVLIAPDTLRIVRVEYTSASAAPDVRPQAGARRRTKAHLEIM